MRWVALIVSAGALVAGSALAADAGVPIRIDDEPRIKIRGCVKSSSKPAHIIGQVTDLDGRPVSGAKLIASGTSDDAPDVDEAFASTQADSDGGYVLPISSAQTRKQLRLDVEGESFAFRSAPAFSIPRGGSLFRVDFVVAPAGTR